MGLHNEAPPSSEGLFGRKVYDGNHLYDLFGHV